MKLKELKEAVDKDIRMREGDESETVKDAPPPGETGEFITTAQAAKILDVNMSRIRQIIDQGELQSHQPEEGRRDHWLKAAEVRAYKDKMKEPGRPEEDD